MSKDYIPDAEGEFLPWEQNLVTYATANMAALGLQAVDVSQLTAAQTAWDGARQACEASQAATRIAVGNKADKRELYEAAIRRLVRRVQAEPTVTDEHRRGLGITVKDDSPTPAIALPASRPMGKVDTSQRLRHEIRFFDENTPTSRAKPAGVMGCEIWVKIGSEPADANDVTFLAFDTTAPYVVEYTAENVGKCAYYMLRWVSTRNEKGPWSETVAATVVG